MSMKGIAGLMAATAMMMGSMPTGRARHDRSAEPRKKLIPPPFSKKVSPLPKGHKIDVIEMQHECRGRIYFVEIEYSYGTKGSQIKRHDARIREVIEYLRETPDNILMERAEFPWTPVPEEK